MSGTSTFIFLFFYSVSFFPSHKNETNSLLKSSENVLCGSGRFINAWVFIKPEFFFFNCDVAKWCDVSSCPSIQYFSHLYKFIFIIEKDYFLDISRAYNTKNFECSRIPSKIQFRHTFSSAISERSCPNRSGFIIVQLKTTHKAKRCNIRIHERKQSLVLPRKKVPAKWDNKFPHKRLQCPEQSYFGES